MAKNPCRYFKASPEIIQLGVLMYVWFPLSLQNVEDLVHKRGRDRCQLRNPEALGWSVRHIARTQDLEAALRVDAKKPPMAVAPGRRLRRDSRLTPLPLASRGSWKRSLGIVCREEAP